MDDEVRITKYKNNFSNVYTENWLGEIFVSDLWTYKIKDLNREKSIGRIYKQELLLSKL